MEAAIVDKQVTYDFARLHGGRERGLLLAVRAGDDPADVRPLEANHDRHHPIAEVLHEAAETHHVVWRITDGDDPDWASWYADWLLNLSRAAGAHCSRRWSVRSHSSRPLRLRRSLTSGRRMGGRWRSWRSGRLWLPAVGPREEAREMLLDAARAMLISYRRACRRRSVAASRSSSTRDELDGLAGHAVLVRTDHSQHFGTEPYRPLAPASERRLARGARQPPGRLRRHRLDEHRRHLDG